MEKKLTNKNNMMKPKKKPYRFYPTKETIEKVGKIKSQSKSAFINEAIADKKLCTVWLAKVD